MTISCSECRADAVAFEVPPDLRSHAPAQAEYAVVCRVCLTVDPIDALPDEMEPLSVVSDALPEDPAAAAAVVVLVGLLESLALNRPDIESVVDYLESEGVDALLVLDRLTSDATLRPVIDLERRTDQLTQLLGVQE